MFHLHVYQTIHVLTTFTNESIIPSLGINQCSNSSLVNLGANENFSKYWKQKNTAIIEQFDIATIGFVFNTLINIPNFLFKGGYWKPFQNSVLKINQSAHRLSIPTYFRFLDYIWTESKVGPVWRLKSDMK